MPSDLFFSVATKGSLASMAEDLGLTENQLDSIAAKAINQEIPGVIDDVVKRVQGEVNLAQREIREQIEHTTATPGSPRAQVRFTGKAIPLIDFKGARQTDEGVEALVWIDDGERLAARAFIATMPSGHMGVFKRRPSRGSRQIAEAIHKSGLAGQLEPLVGRLPIAEKYGPSLPDILTEGDEILQGAVEFAAEDLSDKIEMGIREAITR
jgi:hypothetical protein